LLLAFHNNYVPILHRFCYIGIYWLKINFNLPQLCLAPLGATPFEFHQDLWHHKTGFVWSYI